MTGERARAARTARVRLLTAIVSLQGAGCILEDDRCGPHQVEMRGDYVLCVCEPTAVAQADGSCKPCAANETPSAGQCECASGYARNDDGVCEASDIGAACGDASECSSVYPYCVVEAGGGYCTAADCSGNASCPASFTCETAGDTKVCKKLPNGYGAACASSADCATGAATFCDTFQSKTCQLERCATGETKCPNEWGCCDLTGLLGTSLCVPPDRLTNGCPAGVRLVPQ